MRMHMTPEEFRENGYAVVDWIADYMENVEEYPVLSQVEPGQIAAKIPDVPPETSDGFAAMLSDLDEVVMPGITHWQSPSWFSYFPANVSGPSILGDLAASGLGVQGMLWSTSPSATEIEMKVLDWLVELMGLPDDWRSDGPGGGVIQTTASDANHTALVVARHRRRSDASTEDMVVYTSNQAHSSVEKGCIVAGIGHCRAIGVNDVFALEPELLQAAIDDDIAAGLLPIAVMSTIGTTGTTAVDPIREISEIADAHGMWHHVDAAYAGNSMLCEEFRVHQPDLDRVDSYTFNPHKWMLVNFDCNVMWVADREPLIETLSILPPYLRNAASDSGDVIDYRDWHVPLGRRFRSLKLWWVLRYFGAAGLRTLVRDHVRLADDFAEWVELDDRFELFAPHPFGLVCFTHVDGNDATIGLAEDLNATGKVAVTPSQIDDIWFIRVAIGQAHTDERHVEALWDLIDDLA